MYKPWYMSAQQRKLMNKQFDTMLRASHDSLLESSSRRYPETIEGVLEENPNCTQPEKVVEMNKRTNKLNADMTDLIHRIDPRWKK